MNDIHSCGLRSGQTQDIGEPLPMTLRRIGTETRTLADGRVSRSVVYECHCSARWLDLDIVGGFRSWYRSDSVRTDDEMEQQRKARRWRSLLGVRR